MAGLRREEVGGGGRTPEPMPRRHRAALARPVGEDEGSLVARPFHCAELRCLAKDVMVFHLVFHLDVLFDLRRISEGWR